ncbi:MAG: hypothetical protein NTU99_03720, partial [Pseudanabaena sp. LacPavin_0818_WC45_MAG_42_6]|nr:hypothetical protein [Pseudanabaena sp. LacPavin_0818_WC45_MAG_42_6]
IKSHESKAAAQPIPRSRSRSAPVSGQQAPAQFSRVFWFLSHTCPLVQTKAFIIFIDLQRLRIRLILASLPLT